MSKKTKGFKQDTQNRLRSPMPEGGEILQLIKTKVNLSMAQVTAII